MYKLFEEIQTNVNIVRVCAKPVEFGPQKFSSLIILGNKLSGG